VKARVEREFADVFEQRFNQLEAQLKEKERVALEAKRMLEEIQIASKQQVPPAPPQADEEAFLRQSKDMQEKALSEIKAQ